MDYSFIDMEFLSHIQTALLVFSGLLIVGAVAGGLGRTHYLLEPRTILESRENRESRRAVRHPVTSIVEIIDSSGLSRPESGRLINLSTTGACITSQRFYPKGDPVVIRVHATTPLRLHARIIWSHTRGDRTTSGVRFESSPVVG